MDKKYHGSFYCPVAQSHRQFHSEIPILMFAAGSCTKYGPYLNFLINKISCENIQNGFGVKNK